MKNKLIFVIDLDAFYTSCEEIRNPILKEYPMVVGNELNGRGVVATSNYNARKFGVKSGTPIYIAKEKIKNLKIIPLDFKYYQLKANEVFNIIKKYSNIIEFASIDECYIDVTKLSRFKKPLQIAKEISEEIKFKTNLTVSIGISTNILLAKIASNINKPNGFSTLYESEIYKKLWPLEVSKLFMIGNKISEKLNIYGVKKIKDLANLKNNLEKYIYLKKEIGINLDKYIDYANGKYEKEISIKINYLKSISRQKTYENYINDLSSLRSNTLNLLDYVIYRSKKRKLVPSSISILFKYEKNLKWKKISVKLNFPSLNKNELINKIDYLIEKIFFKDKNIKSLGVSFDGLKQSVKVYKQSKIKDLSFKEKNELQKITEIASNKLNLNVVKASTMENNRNYENIDPVDNDSVKFKAWEK